METERPGYYAIIPADVRYDDRIPANAKLLYGEISALIGKDGFCYASNQYFARLYGMADDTITRLFSKLEKAGYIKRELEKDASGQVVRRKIFLNVSMPEIHPPGFLSGTLPDKKSGGTGQKVGETNTSISNYIPPLIPPEGERVGGKQRRSRGKDYKENPDVLPERFNGFWLFYRTHIPPDRSAGNRQAAIRAWDKLAPSDELATTMAKALARQVGTQAWIGGVGVPHASTWLNNHGWEDDWGGAADVQGSAPAGEQEAGEWL